MKHPHPLDELIRQRIATLPEAAPRGWDDLADRLNAPADAALAGKLATIAPAAAPAAGSWQALAGKLDALEPTAAQHPIDATVTTALEQATPTTVSGWARLAARLELTGRRREMVGCVKVTEAALMLSFLVLLLRFGTDSTVDPLRPVLADAGGTPFPLGLVPEPDGQNGDRSEVARPAILPPVAAPAPRMITPVATLRIATPQVRPTRSLQLPPVSLSISAVDALATNRYSVIGAERPTSPPLSINSLMGGAPIRYYLNLFISPVDVNDVFTFENRSIGVLEDRRILSTGFSVGALLDINQQRNALQTGLLYGKRSYVPAEILNLEQDTFITNPDDKVRYGRLTYHTVSIPLNYERQISESDKWRISAGVGLSMNVILASEFRLDSDATLEDLDQAVDYYVSTLSKKAKPSGRAASARSLSTVRRPDPGYLEGGSLLENSSLYLSGNLRIERLVSDRMSFYLSPTVSRLVTVRKFDGGKGPLEDRIHNTMFRFGTRIRLSNK